MKSPTKKQRVEIENSSATDDASDGSITVNVMFTGKTIPISTSTNSTVQDLKSLLLRATDVLTRCQTLIFKGKILENFVTLTASGLRNGSKLMLLASKDQEEKKVKVGSRYIFDDSEKSPVMTRFERWSATCVIALSDCNLKVIPDDVWNYGDAKVLDCSYNSIQKVPEKIARLRCLRKLYLNANGMLDGTVSWEALTHLHYLTILALNRNHLTTLPSALGSLTTLRVLHVSNNKLRGLPSEIGHLKKLEVLQANNNRMIAITDFIGDCSSLVEVNFSSNFLSELPEAFSNLSNLEHLRLSNNGMKSLPPKLLKNCPQLCTLDLHNTEVTNDLLSQLEGWDNFEERRRLKHQKLLSFRVGVGADLDEGADHKD